MPVLSKCKTSCTMHYDLNCDMGEGIGNEEQLMPFITSANIACGFHAGDKDTMKKVVDLCIDHGVAIGAHPSYNDRENFGRIDLIGKSMTVAEVEDVVTEQMVVLQGIAKERGASLHHVKPHGALYNRAAWDGETGAAICRAMVAIDPKLFLYGLSGSSLKEAAESFGLPFLHEVFADRTYRDDGSLTPRTDANALIQHEDEAVEQVTKMIQSKTVRTSSGKCIPIEAQTICVHGDGMHAVAFARRLHQLLKV